MQPRRCRPNPIRRERESGGYAQRAGDAHREVHRQSVGCNGDYGSYTVSFPPPAPTYAVSVTGKPATISLAAGATSGTATFTVADHSTNLGGQTQTYTLTPTCSGVGQQCSTPQPVTLNGGDSTSVSVSFQVGAAGTTGSVVLTATANATGNGSVSLTTTPVYALAITPPAFTQRVNKSATNTYTYPFMVRNTSKNASLAMDVTLSVGGCVTVTSCQLSTSTLTVAPADSSPQTVTFHAPQLGSTVLSVTATGTVGGQTVANGSAVDSVTVVNAPPQGAIAISPTSDNVSADPGADLTVAFTISSTDIVADSVAYHISCVGAVSNCHDGLGAVDGKTAAIPQSGVTSAAVTVSYHVNGNAGPVGVVMLAAHGVRDSSLTAKGQRAVGVIGVPPLIVDAKSVEALTSIARDQCVTISAGAAAAYQCGDLRVVHSLPATTTMNKTRAPTLVYNSREANPTVLVAANVSLDPTRAVTSLEATVRVFNNQNQALTSPVTVSYAWSDTNDASVTSRIVVPVDFTTLGLPTPLTGLYRAIIQVTAKAGTTVVGTAVDTTVRLVVVDRSTSQFGRGWWLDGLEQVVTGNMPDANHVLWIGGDGNARTFSQVTPRVWLGFTTLDRVDTLEHLGDTWVRYLPNGAYVTFDNAGRQIATQMSGARPGNGADTMPARRTTFHYDGSGALDQITLPVASGTRPSYLFNTTRDANQNMTTLIVTSPPIGAQARVTTVKNNPAALRDTIVDADGMAVAFAYDANGRITGRTDRLGHTTNFDYDATGGTLVHSTLRLASVPDTGTVVHTFCAGEGIGLPPNGGATPPCLAGPVDTGAVRMLYDGPRNDVADTTAIHIDRFGAPTKIVDALGDVTRIVRDATFPLLADSIIDPVGHITTAHYTERGLVDMVVNVAPYGAAAGDAITRNFWNARFDVMDSTVGPTGESMHFTFDQSTVDLLTQADGRGAFTTARFTYNANRQPETVSGLATRRSSTRSSTTRRSGISNIPRRRLGR